MLRDQQGYRAHQELLGVLDGCIGTGIDCRYSGLEGHQEAPRGVGAIRGALGLAGSVEQGSAGYRGLVGASGVY